MKLFEIKPTITPQAMKIAELVVKANGHEKLLHCIKDFRSATGTSLRSAKYVIEIYLAENHGRVEPWTDSVIINHILDEIKALS